MVTRLDGDYMLVWTVPVGRSQHGATGAMGSWKALLKLVETKDVRSQCFLHPKIELSEHPELFGCYLYVIYKVITAYIKLLQL